MKKQHRIKTSLQRLLTEKSAEMIGSGYNIMLFGNNTQRIDRRILCQMTIPVPAEISKKAQNRNILSTRNGAHI